MNTKIDNFIRIFKFIKVKKQMNADSLVLSTNLKSKRPSISAKVINSQCPNI